MKNRHPKSDDGNNHSFDLNAVTLSATKAARQVLGRNHRDLVPDAVNKALGELWKLHLAGNLPDKPVPWVYRVAYNEALLLVKRENRYPVGLLEECDPDEETGYAAMPANTSNPAEDALLTERFNALKKVLEVFYSTASSQLNENETQLFRLLHGQNLTSTEVAAKLGVTPEQVRKQWGRMLPKVLKLVREQLKQDPACSELLGSFLNNEKTFNGTLLSLLRFVADKGVKELERWLRSLFNR